MAIPIARESVSQAEGTAARRVARCLFAPLDKVERLDVPYFSAGMRGRNLWSLWQRQPFGVGS